MNILQAAKGMHVTENVAFRVIDLKTRKVVQTHVGHNTATNSMLLGVAHYLVGDGTLGQGSSMLSSFVPQYISLGTMGLMNQEQDADGLPAGLGSNFPPSGDPRYEELLEAEQEAKVVLEAAKEELAQFCPYYPYNEFCESCTTCSSAIESKKQAVEDAQAAYDAALADLLAYSEMDRCIDYLQHRPGFGADGYDANQNNGRKWFGLGYPFANRPDPTRTVNCELISTSFPRARISFRDIVPEIEAEVPKTIDVVFSAMISTGALKEFREEGKDYVFITEAGLWASPDWNDSGENGLLAGYRLAPSEDKYLDMTVPENRQRLKECILKVGINQVVQVIWKIQIGSIDQFPLRDINWYQDLDYVFTDEDPEGVGGIEIRWSPATMQPTPDTDYYEQPTTYTDEDEGLDITDGDSH